MGTKQVLEGGEMKTVVSGGPATRSATRRFRPATRPSPPPDAGRPTPWPRPSADLMVRAAVGAVALQPGTTGFQKSRNPEEKERMNREFETSNKDL
jgi:hypothetical protein